MDIKLKGVVKHGGTWKRPDDIIRKVDEEIAEELIAKGIAEEVEPLPEDDSELQALRERAKVLGVASAGRLGEAKLKEAIAEKEVELQELRTKAAELDIEGFDTKTAEELTAAIAEAEKK
ncbi:hypothetical protein A3844_01685 [Paenibacillus helianthi]|uniref:DUF7210 domain-containing protein n=1 Tax=Paenibacillus helianthi TaxID=1349432 RepID=A0ABX3EWW3_9BACL|nr:hypothetical protein [Paenibacillus helianthi]OKP91851.1 hypothetical protein A3844_01685 [Paenibacillus helianthi]